ncbi:hypothetical protein HS125_08735 [bacterium]|nr:hypothetical protein [bacterium]
MAGVEDVGREDSATHSQLVRYGGVLAVLLASWASLTPARGEVYTQPNLEWETVMVPDQEWEYGRVGASYILFEDGRFRIWYTTGNSQPITIGSAWGGIGYAESLDGRTWFGKRFLVKATDDGGTSYGMIYPVVMKASDTYFLYCANYYKLYQGDYWTYLTVRASTDGYSFGPPTQITTPSDHEPWEDMYYTPRGVFFDPLTAGYRFFYEARYRRAPDTPRYYLASMVSADAVHWSTRTRSLGEEGTFIHPDRQMVVYQEGDLYRVLYAGTDGRIRRAVSVDGLQWEGIVNGWTDGAPLLSALADPPPDLHQPQYVKAPGGAEYIYFWYSPDGETPPGDGGPLTHIGRVMLRPPLDLSVTAHISPPEPRTLDDLVCVVDIDPPTAAADLSILYRWWKNDQELTDPAVVAGVPYAVTRSVLPHEITSRGESYYCFARITDGTSYLDRRTSTVNIRNSPPTAPIVTIVPVNPQPWDGLGAEFVEYSIDPDGDPISYEIRWYRSQDGGQTFVYRIEVSGVVPEGSWVPPAFLREGDIWRVEAIPFELASAKASGGVAAARIDGDKGWDQAYVGANYRPTVVVQAPGPGNLWATPSVRIGWRAGDPDGGPLRVDLYYDADAYPGGEVLLQSGLPGTGVLEWTPPRGHVGVPSLDLTADGRLLFDDLFQLALAWGVPLRGGAAYRIFARVWDDKNAVGTDYSDGLVIVSEKIPPDGGGLLELIENWRTPAH